MPWNCPSVGLDHRLFKRLNVLGHNLGQNISGQIDFSEPPFSPDQCCCFCLGCCLAYTPNPQCSGGALNSHWKRKILLKIHWNIYSHSGGASGGFPVAFAFHRNHAISHRNSSSGVFFHQENFLLCIINVCSYTILLHTCELHTFL